MIRLSDLVCPLTTDEFTHDYWEAHRHHIAVNVADRLDDLFAIPELQSAEGLVAATNQQVKLFGPDDFRSYVPSQVALDFYEQGDTLYFTGLEDDVLATRQLRPGIAEDLGVPPESVFFEAFAARAGAVSTIHYDWDANFQVLLSGRKTWSLAPNQNVRNPLHSFILRQSWGDEVFARDRDLPNAMPSDATNVETGSVLFLPRGMWHQTRAEENCIGFNFVLRPTMWYAGFCKALAQRLEQHEDFRSFGIGGLGTGSIYDSAEDQFERLKVRFIAAARDIAFDEVLLSHRESEWKWRRDFLPRIERPESDNASLVCDSTDSNIAVELTPRQVVLVSKLLLLRHRFGLKDAMNLSVNLSMRDILDLLTDLQRAGFLMPPSGSASANLI